MTLVLGLAFVWTSTGAWAGGVVRLESQQLHRQDGTLLLNAQFRVELPKKAVEALRRGVPLPFSQKFELVRKRDWWLEEGLIAEQRQYQLSYRSGADKYRLHFGAEHQDFDTQEAALQALGTISDWSMTRAALPASKDYEARLRLHLEANRLPQMLQLTNLFGPGLDLDSGWQAWKPGL